MASATKELRKRKMAGSMRTAVSNVEKILGKSLTRRSRRKSLKRRSRRSSLLMLPTPALDDDAPAVVGSSRLPLTSQCTGKVARRSSGNQLSA